MAQASAYLAKEFSTIHDFDPVLHQASYSGNLDKVKSLLKKSQERKLLNARNRLGCTPVRLAAAEGHADTIMYLVGQGAEVDITDFKGQTALAVAVKKRHFNCMNVLLDAGANPDGDGKSLYSPLYNAAMDGFLEGIKVLVEHGAEVDSPADSTEVFKNSPIYITMVYRHLECFQYLLQAGADPNAINKLPGSRSVLLIDVIRKKACVQYAELLYLYGANLNVKDSKDQRPDEMDIEETCCSPECQKCLDVSLKQFICDIYCAPRSLLHLARIRIRQHLGKRRLDRIHDLPLPKQLRKFCSMMDVF